MTWFDIVKRKRYGEDEVGRMGIGPETFFRKPQQEGAIGSYDSNTGEYSFQPTDDADAFANTLAEEVTHEVQNIVAELDGINEEFRQEIQTLTTQLENALMTSGALETLAEAMDIGVEGQQNLLARQIIRNTIQFIKKSLGRTLVLESHAKTHSFDEANSLYPQISAQMAEYTRLALMQVIDTLINVVTLNLSPNYIDIFNEEFMRAIPEFLGNMISFVANTALKEIYGGNIKADDKDVLNTVKLMLVRSLEDKLEIMRNFMGNYFMNKLEEVFNA
tara:strand:- start:906 stop:1733 length:828 start_codon:yes stop_codon:yes gene_type:complete